MPYIKKEYRDFIDTEIDMLKIKLDSYAADDIEGVLNYTVTRLLSVIYQDKRYKNLNRAIGVLECAKLELYRKIIGPYENKAEFTNGNIDEWTGNEQN